MSLTTEVEGRRVEDSERKEYYCKVYVVIKAGILNVEAVEVWDITSPLNPPILIMACGDISSPFTVISPPRTDVCTETAV